jgi:hypothetical protein
VRWLRGRKGTGRPSACVPVRSSHGQVAASVGPVHAEFNLTIPCASFGVCQVSTQGVLRGVVRGYSEEHSVQPKKSHALFDVRS